MRGVQGHQLLPQRDVAPIDRVHGLQLVAGREAGSDDRIDHFSRIGEGSLDADQRADRGRIDTTAGGLPRISDDRLGQRDIARRDRLRCTRGDKRLRDITEAQCVITRLREAL